MRNFDFVEGGMAKAFTSILASSARLILASGSKYPSGYPFIQPW